MTKLEEKLMELGYERLEYSSFIYTKKYKEIKFYVWLSVNKKYISNEQCCIQMGLGYFHSQQDIDNLQQAFNQLTKDLEVLKEYEKLD